MGDTSNDLLTLLSDLGRLMRVEADRRARAYGLTRAQWVILSRVKSGPGLSQRELAELLEVEPITVGRLVDRLEGQGLVERRPDPLDRRIWRLHLRQAAAAVLAPLDQQRDDITALLTQGLAAAELDQLAFALALMKTNITAHRKCAPAAAIAEAG
jgi:MarR family transcriptional regulator for hemolysin